MVLNDIVPFDESNNTSNIVPLNDLDTSFSNVLASWIATRAYYNLGKEYLETQYKSPYDLHKAHTNAINVLDSILNELTTIVQASRRLREKQHQVNNLLKCIEATSYEDLITPEKQQAIDDEVRKTFSQLTKSNYDEINRIAEKISLYIVDKLYLSFVEGKEVNEEPIISSDAFPIMFLAPPKLLASKNEELPTELCNGILNKYLEGKELPIPALVINIYIDSQIKEGSTVDELKVFGAEDSKESSIIYFWKFNKSPYKQWLTSICGKSLAYCLLLSKKEDKVNAILSRINTM